MNRRAFFAGIAGAALTPLAARAEVDAEKMTVEQWAAWRRRMLNYNASADVAALAPQVIVVEAAEAWKELERLPSQELPQEIEIARGTFRFVSVGREPSGW